MGDNMEGKGELCTIDDKNWMERALKSPKLCNLFQGVCSYSNTMRFCLWRLKRTNKKKVNPVHEGSRVCEV